MAILLSSILPSIEIHLVVCGATIDSPVQLCVGIKYIYIYIFGSVSTLGKVTPIYYTDYA